MLFANGRVLNDSNGNPMSAFAIANAATVYSETINIQKNVGYGTLLLTENKAGGGGSVTVWPEYSIDNVNFYKAYTTAAGALTIDPNIVTTLDNKTRWVVFTSRLAKFMRIGFLANADSQVTAALVYQEQDS